MEKKLKKDIIGWDIANWSLSLDLFEKNIDFKNRKKVLELGASGVSGGYSLFFANKGHLVTCSGLNKPNEELISVHQKYNCHTSIAYKAIDATNIPDIEKFDIVCFKSMLGGICRGNNQNKAKDVFRQIHKVLKPNGHLVFAENLGSTWIHMAFRNKFGSTIGDKSGNWYFFSLNELINLIKKDYEVVDYSTAGFLGCFGRNEWQKNLLGFLDKNILDFIIPKKWNYIFFSFFKKLN